MEKIIHLQLYGDHNFKLMIFIFKFFTHKYKEKILKIN